MNRAVVAGALAAILVVAVVAGSYFLSSRGGSVTISTSTTTTSPDTSSASQTNPLGGFGGQTFSIPVGGAPYGMAYDPVSGETFVAASGSSTVAILNNQSLVVGNVTLGGAADFLAYDASDSLLYAPLVGSNSIAVINTTLDTVVSSVSVGTSAGWVAYDPASATIYAVNRESNTVSVVSDTTLVKTISLTGLPFAAAYDPDDGDMYVTNNAGAVFVINGTSNTLLTTVQVGGSSSDLLGIAYNSADQRMYVTSYSDGKVYIVNGSQAAGSIGGFDQPIGISFKTGVPEMFVVNSGNDTVSASLDGTSSTVSVGQSPREVLYDPSFGSIVVTDYGGTTLSVVVG